MQYLLKPEVSVMTGVIAKFAFNTCVCECEHSAAPPAHVWRQQRLLLRVSRTGTVHLRFSAQANTRAATASKAKVEIIQQPCCQQLTLTCSSTMPT